MKKISAAATEIDLMILKEQHSFRASRYNSDERSDNSVTQMSFVYMTRWYEIDKQL